MIHNDQHFHKRTESIFTYLMLGCNNPYFVRYRMAQNIDGGKRVLTNQGWENFDE